MKKSIIALAVAGALTVPMVAQADATLYGRVHERVQFVEDKDVNVQNAEARLGVKGSSDMDSGLTAFYQIETALRGDGEADRQSSNSRQSGDGTLQVRQLNAGVEGDGFGKIVIGRFTNPTTSTYKGDVFEGESGAYQLTPFRIGNAIAYTTPSFGGLTATVAMIGEGEGNDSTFEDVDAYVLQAGGAFGAFHVAVSYMDADYETANATSAKEIQVTSLGLAYSANGLYVGLGLEDDDVSDNDVVDFGVKYTAGKTGYGFGYAKKSGVGKVEDDRVFVGVYHKLGGRADVYTELAKHDATDAAGVDTDFNRLSIGYRVKF
jgi:predicted porin